MEISMLPNQLSTENLACWMLENEFTMYQAGIVCTLKEDGFDYQQMLTSKLSVGYSDIYDLMIRRYYSVDIIRKSNLTDKEMIILVAYIDGHCDLIDIQPNGDQYNVTIADTKLTLDKELFDIARELRTKQP